MMAIFKLPIAQQLAGTLVASSWEPVGADSSPPLRAESCNDYLVKGVGNTVGMAEQKHERL